MPQKPQIHEGLMALVKIYFWADVFISIWIA